ncbi:hypothetical protein [Brevibacillus borstelensis]|nr:hypothetical protein [Brevibacillus borstelensis]
MDEPNNTITQLHRAPKSGSERRSEQGAAPEYIKPGCLNKVNGQARKRLGHRQDSTLYAVV